MPPIRLIDISVPIESGMFRFPRPDHVKVSISEEGSYEDVNCRTSRIVMGSHSGTHIDAPMHMMRGGLTIDNVPLEYLVGRARVVRTRSRPGTTISRRDLDQSLLDEKRIILDSGWHRNWGSARYYEDFPVVSEELAELMVQKGVKCLVVDLPLTLEVHNIMLESGACQVENVINLDQIKADKVMLMALPLRIVGIDAAPARVVVAEDAE